MTILQQQKSIGEDPDSLNPQTGPQNWIPQNKTAEQAPGPNHSWTGESKSILCDPKSARTDISKINPRYPPQDNTITKQQKEPTDEPTTAKQEQVGGKPTYLKRSSIEYNGETIHFTHFGGDRPSTNQYKSYNGIGLLLGRSEGYQGNSQSMMPPTSIPPGHTKWGKNWISNTPPNTWGEGKWQYPAAHRPFTSIQSTLDQQVESQ